jgi:sugar lactone lactonase YvrE
MLHGDGRGATATVPWRWLRLALLVAALAAGAAGQYWLSIYHVARWSAAAWSAAAGCFVLLYALGGDARDLPAAGELDLPRRTEWVLLAGVLAVGVFFAVFRLWEFPPGLNHDAAWEGLYAIRILQGMPYTPYVSAAWGRETFTFYLRALSILILGPTKMAVQAPSVIAGVLTLPFLYWWARNMFGARFALLATLLLGVSGWHLIFSRTGWRSDFQPFFTTITCCFFIRGMLTASPLDFALSGVALALTVNTYNAARALPLLFPPWVLASMLQSWRWRGFLRRYGIGLATMTLTFGVTVAPLAWYAVNNWGKFQARAVALEGMTTVWGAVKQTLLLFNYWGNGDDFFITTPGLEYPTAIFLVFGILWGLARLRDERVQFLLLGLVVNCLGGVISKPNMNRNIGTMPFIYFFVALGVTFFATQLRRVIPRFGRFVATAFVIIVGAAATQATYAQYLSHNRRNVFGYYPETTVLGRYLKTLVPQYRIFVGGANFPRDALTYLSYPGTGDPLVPNYTWLDDVTMLLRARFLGPADKGLAFVLANEDRGPAVLAELQRRYPQHQVVDLYYPEGSRRVFAKAVLVPATAANLPASEQASAAQPPAAGPPNAAAVAPLQDPPGQLRQPRGVAVTADGEELVCDFGNHRIQEFGRDARLLRGWGQRGKEPGEFEQPGAVAVAPSGEIVVADTWNQRVQVFSKTGEFVREFGGGFFGPRGIAVDGTGSIFVSDTGNNRVVRFSATGKQERVWGGKGAAPGQFVEPVGITVDATGHVYVCDNANERLQVFTRDGQFVTMFAVPGWGPRAYSEPHVTIDHKGTIWITVPASKEIRNYDTKGTLLRTVTSQSIPGVTFETPMGIAYDAVGRELIVSDLKNRLVRIPLQR